jgi:hypothetical protein
VQHGGSANLQATCRGSVFLYQNICKYLTSSVLKQMCRDLVEQLSVNIKILSLQLFVFNLTYGFDMLDLYIQDLF